MHCKHQTVDFCTKRQCHIMADSTVCDVIQIHKDKICHMLYILIFFVVLFQQVAWVRDRVPALVQCLWHSYLLVPSLVLRNKRNSFSVIIGTTKSLRIPTVYSHTSAGHRMLCVSCPFLFVIATLMVHYESSFVVMMSITVEDYETQYWPKLEHAIHHLLTTKPSEYIPISYEQMYTYVEPVYSLIDCNL